MFEMVVSFLHWPPQQWHVLSPACTMIHSWFWLLWNTVSANLPLCIVADNIYMSASISHVIPFCFVIISSRSPAWYHYCWYIPTFTTSATAPIMLITQSSSNPTMSTDNSFDAAVGVLKRKPDDDLNEPEQEILTNSRLLATLKRLQTVVPFDNRRKDMRYARSRIEWKLVNLLNVKKCVRRIATFRRLLFAC
jgi:hypothetical protein